MILRNGIHNHAQLYKKVCSELNSPGVKSMVGLVDEEVLLIVVDSYVLEGSTVNEEVSKNDEKMLLVTPVKKELVVMDVGVSMAETKFKT